MTRASTAGAATMSSPIEKTIPGYILRGEIESTISALTGAKIPVEFAGAQAYVAYTTPAAVPTIRIPELSSTEQYPESKALVLRGYSNHECAHVLYSEIPYVWTFAKRKLSAVLGKILGAPNSREKIDTPEQRAALGIDEKEYWIWRTSQYIDNTIEDWRIERAIKRAYPGSFLNIAKTRLHVNERQAAELAGVTEMPMPNALGAMITWAGCIDNAYPCAAIAKANLDRASALCPDGRQMLDAYWPAILQLGSHREVMELAFDIAVECANKYFKKDPPPPPPQQQAQQQQQPQNSPQQNQPSSQPGAGKGNDGSDRSDSNSSKTDDQADPSSGAQPQTKPDATNSDPSGDPKDTKSDANPPTGADGTSPSDQNQPQGGSGGQSNDQKNNNTADGQGAGASDQHAPAPQQDNTGDPSKLAQGADHDAQPGSSSSSSPPQSGAAPGGTSQSAGPQGQQPQQQASHGQAGGGVTAGSGSPSQQGASSGGAAPLSPTADSDAIPTTALDVSDVIAAIVKATGAGADEHDLSRIEIRISDDRDMPNYHRLLQKGGASAARVAQAARKLLTSETYRRERFQLEDGDLDLSNLIGISTGSSDIYSRRDARKDRAASVVFCLDLSASMREKDRSGKTRLDHLAEATAALASAIGTDRDVHTAALTYTSAPASHLIKWIKRFTDAPSALKSAIGAIPADGENGGTPTHFGLLEAQKALRLRSEKRKILFLITDGEASDRKRTLSAANGIIRSGVYLVGIGIGPNAPTMKIPGWRNIRDTSELPILLTQIVSDVLQQTKRAA